MEGRKNETVKIIKKWADSYYYNLKDIEFARYNAFLIIDLECLSIIFDDLDELMEDIRMYYNNAHIYSIDNVLDNGMCIWISL